MVDRENLKSTLIIFERYANLKYKYRNRNFCTNEYYVSIVGLNKESVTKYIIN